MPAARLDVEELEKNWRARSAAFASTDRLTLAKKNARPAGRASGRWVQACYIFFSGAFAAAAGLRSNFPVLSEKNTHSEALSQAVVWR